MGSHTRKEHLRFLDGSTCFAAGLRRPLTLEASKCGRYRPLFTAPPDGWGRAAVSRNTEVDAPCEKAARVAVRALFRSARRGANATFSGRNSVVIFAAGQLCPKECV